VFPPDYSFLDRSRCPQLFVCDPPHRFSALPGGGDAALFEADRA
jgi:hypothetical protein